MSTVRKYQCMCGAFEAQVTGEPVLAVWCHCETCRRQTGAAMQLGVFQNFEVIKGDDQLINMHLPAVAYLGTVARTAVVFATRYCLTEQRLHH